MQAHLKGFNDVGFISYYSESQFLTWLPSNMRVRQYLHQISQYHIAYQYKRIDGMYIAQWAWVGTNRRKKCSSQLICECIRWKTNKASAAARNRTRIQSIYLQSLFSDRQMKLPSIINFAYTTMKVSTEITRAKLHCANPMLLLKHGFSQSDLMSSCCLLFSWLRC